MAYGDDARARNQIGYQQQRFQNQQGPLANYSAYNYGRGAESNYGDYTDIMNRYRGIAGGQGAGASTGGFGPSTISYNDPFNSYAGFTEFSKTGGYSPADIANMRARGVSPIRASYANAQREIGRQRSLQGGYSPNAIASQVKMAREQGQSMADATQNVEAGLAEARNRGRLSGLSGMSNIEGQRLQADLDVGKFNAQAQMAAAASGQSAAAQANENQLAALRGMTQLYGTNPGMAETFGNQALNAVNMGGQFGSDVMGRQISAGQLPGNFENTMNRIGQIGDIAAGAGGAIYPWLNDGQSPYGGYGGGTYGGNTGVAGGRRRSVYGG